MTTPEPESALTEKKPVGERAGEIAKKGAQQVAIWVGVAVVAVIVYSIGAAVIPRWWAQRVGEWVNKSMITGTGLGLTFGILCTLIPLLLLLFAVKRIRRSPKLAAAAAILAVIIALPNLMTASIAAGVSNAAKAGRDVMNVDAPMFRGATLWGAIIGVVLAIAIPIAVKVHRKRREERKLQKAADKAAAKQAKIAAKEESRAQKAAARTEGQAPEPSDRTVE